MAASNDLDDVPNGSAGERGDDADAVWKGRQRSTWAVEETFTAKAVAKLLEGELQCAGAARAQGFGDELKLAAAFVHRDASTNLDREAIPGLEAEKLRLPAEEYDGKLRVAILEREVDMAGSGGTEIRNLALDVEDAGVGAFEMLSQLRDQLTDRVENWLHRSRHGRRGGDGWGDDRVGEIERKLRGGGSDRDSCRV